MKVPYLNKIISEEYNTYLDELAKSTEKSITEARELNQPKRLYTVLYPLFSLLRELSDTRYVRNPAREIILSEMQSNSNKKGFVEVITKYNKSDEYKGELSKGIQKNTFTEYYDELFSDALLLLNGFCTYDYRSAQIAMRCMLEDLYRHLYYKDHPEEFWACSNNSHRLSPKELRDYLTRTSYLSPFHNLNEKFNLKDTDDLTLFSTNEILYAECSSYVHGSDELTMNSFMSNLDFICDDSRANEFLNRVERFVKMAVAFLIAAHLDNFLAFNDYEKSIILEAYNKSERAAFRKEMNV